MRYDPVRVVRRDLEPWMPGVQHSHGELDAHANGSYNSPAWVLKKQLGIQERH